MPTVPDPALRSADSLWHGPRALRLGLIDETYARRLTAAEANLCRPQRKVQSLNPSESFPTTVAARCGSQVTSLQRAGTNYGTLPARARFLARMIPEAPVLAIAAVSGRQGEGWEPSS